MARQPRTPGVPAPKEEPIQPTPVDEPVGLPNAIDIDASKISAPVLTNQGWVCPADQTRRGPF